MLAYLYFTSVVLLWIVLYVVGKFYLIYNAKKNIYVYSTRHLVMATAMTSVLWPIVLVVLTVCFIAKAFDYCISSLYETLENLIKKD